MNLKQHNSFHNQSRHFERCPLCAGIIKIKYKDLSDRFNTTTERFHLYECTVCRIGFLNPMPSGDLSNYYPANYLSSESQEPPKYIKKIDLEKWYRYDQYNFDFNLLKKSSGINIGQCTSFIDIGCGSGERVNYVYEKGCKRSWGIDKFDFKKKHLNPETRFIISEILDYKPYEKFQVASLAHVLEHVENPLEVLSYIKENILAENGFLFIQVPNYDALERLLFKSKWFCLDAPRHLWHFNKSSLQTILIHLGYKIEGCYTVNAFLHPVSIVSSLFKSLDIQRIWIDRKHNNFYKGVLKLLWAGFTIATIPLNVIQNLFHRGSMLTIIVKNVPV